MRSIRRRGAWLAGTVAVLGALAVTTALAGSSRNHSADLRGFAEVPAVSSAGDGDFTARVVDETVEWQLSYADLEGQVTQAHLHLAQRGVNGGIAVWLCSNLASPPTPAGLDTSCPPQGTVTGAFDRGDIVGPASQGLTTDEFEELLAAVRAGVVYANVHTTKHPGGELRGQLRQGTAAD